MMRMKGEEWARQAYLYIQEANTEKAKGRATKPHHDDRKSEKAECILWYPGYSTDHSPETMPIAMRNSHVIHMRGPIRAKYKLQLNLASQKEEKEVKAQIMKSSVPLLIF